MNDKKIYLMRHGETDMNRRECLQGQVDSELNEVGIAEAERTAAILSRAGIVFGAVYSSPLKRAFRTAEIAASGAAVTPEPLIKEVYFGHYEGMRYSDIDAGMWAFIHDPENVQPPEGVESIHSLVERTGQFLRRIIASDVQGSILCVSHGIALRAMLRNLYSGADGSRVWSMPIENCIIYEVTVRDGEVVSVRRADELSQENEGDTSKVF